MLHRCIKLTCKGSGRGKTSLYFRTSRNILINYFEVLTVLFLLVQIFTRKFEGINLILKNIYKEPPIKYCERIFFSLKLLLISKITFIYEYTDNAVAEIQNIKSQILVYILSSSHIYIQYLLILNTHS